MRKKGKLIYRPRVEKIMDNDYNKLDICRLALGLIEPYSRVLSIGCGSGREIKFLRSIYCDVTAIDINPKFLNKSKNIEPNFKYICGDAVHMKFDKKFDYIICLWNTINAFPGLKNRQIFIKNCYHNLKNKGQLIMTTKSYLAGFLPINDYTIASLEAGGNKWWEETNFIVNKIMADKIWIIHAQK